jgi:hypothetical protein
VVRHGAASRLVDLCVFGVNYINVPQQNILNSSDDPDGPLDIAGGDCIQFNYEHVVAVGSLAAPSGLGRYFSTGGLLDQSDIECHTSARW